MVLDAIYVNYQNEKHLKWWTNIGSKLVKYELLDAVIDKQGKITGYVFAVEGMFSKFVINKNNKFIENQEVVYFTKD